MFSGDSIELGITSTKLSTSSLDSKYNFNYMPEIRPLLTFARATMKTPELQEILCFMRL